MVYKPTCKSYFSGAGLMDLGLMQAGINVVQSLEIDKTCIDTLRSNFNHAIISADIKDITVKSQTETDIIVGTYPCTNIQPLPTYTAHAPVTICFYTSSGILPLSNPKCILLRMCLACVSFRW